MRPFLIINGVRVSIKRNGDINLLHLILAANAGGFPFSNHNHDIVAWFLKHRLDERPVYYVSKEGNVSLGRAYEDPEDGEMYVSEMGALECASMIDADFEEQVYHALKKKHKPRDHAEITLEIARQVVELERKERTYQKRFEMLEKKIEEQQETLKEQEELLSAISGELLKILHRN